MFVRILYRGEAVQANGLEPEARVDELKERVAEMTEVPKRLQKLVWKGKVLGDDAVTLKDVGLAEGAKVFLVGSTEEDIALVQSSQPDRVLKPFEDDIPLRRKYEERPSRSIAQPSKYCFLRTEALLGLPKQERASELLNQLANDRGVLAVMKKHRWVVGALKEMYPDGKVGVDPVCVLGYNMNKGQEIRLRLRTDDLRGFRPYYKLLEVLCHELSHNVHSDHNRAFYDLMNQIKRETKELDWTQSSGQSVSGYAAGPASLPGPRPEPSRPSQPAATRVGGDMSARSRMSAAEAAAGAAELRLKSRPQGEADSGRKASSTSHVHPLPVAIDSAPASMPDGASTRDLEMELQVTAGRLEKAMETTIADDVECSGTLPQLQSVDVGDVMGSEVPIEATETMRNESSEVSDPMAMQTALETALASAPAETVAPVASEADSRIELLTGMGFSDSVAQRALHSCAGDVEAAVNWIVSRGLS